MTIPPSEKVYVLEINGAPILAFAAVSHREAQSLLREEWLRADLRGIRSGGKPIWDGTAKLGSSSRRRSRSYSSSETSPVARISPFSSS